MRFKDPRIAQLIRAIEERFPGTTVVDAGRTPDMGPDEEGMLAVLNAPSHNPVHDFVDDGIDRLWGDEPWPVGVWVYDREQTANSEKYSHHLGKPRRPARRRRAAGTRRRTAQAR